MNEVVWIDKLENSGNPNQKQGKWSRISQLACQPPFKNFKKNKNIQGGGCLF